MGLKMLMILLWQINPLIQNRMKETPMDTLLIEQTRYLIECGTAFNLEALDAIYSPALRIVRLDENANVTVLNKAENMAFFRLKKDSGATPLSRTAEFHYAERKCRRGYVFLTRTMKLNDRWEELKYHIEWVYEKNRWRVVHENVFAQPAQNSN